MIEPLNPNTLFIVTGASLRAERMDRPLAYRLRDEALQVLAERVNAEPEVLVISDVWYLNCRDLHAVPTISVGGPGVNHVTAYWQNLVPPALVVENVFRIQMDVTGQDTRCCIWGMDHETTVEAVDTFVSRGHLGRYLTVFPPAIE